MYEIVIAGGWVMLPILVCSVLVVAIVVERLWSLNSRRLMPANLLLNVWDQYKNGRLNQQALTELRSGSPLGEVFAAGLSNRMHGRDVMKDAMEEAGSKVIHELERFMAPLATIAAIAPLLGLLGTVLGMIEVFNEIMLRGTGNAGELAGGISKALITTAAGLTVAIPSMVFHRYFDRRIEGMAVTMEQQSARLVDAIFATREAPPSDPAAGSAGDSE